MYLTSTLALATIVMGYATFVLRRPAMQVFFVGMVGLTVASAFPVGSVVYSVGNAIGVIAFTIGGAALVLKGVQ